MENLIYVFDGNRVEWFYKRHEYFTTNSDGEGIFVVYPYKNERRQLVGTADFYLTGSKEAKRAKIRRWMRKQKGE